MKKPFYHLVISCCLLTTAPEITLAQSGSLDPTFGNGGKVSTSIGVADDFGISVAVQNDSKIVVAGYSYNGSDYDVAVVRYLSDGSPDSSFGTGGKVTTPVGSTNDYGLAVAMQNNGNIVVAGYSFNGVNNDFAVIRYAGDGSLDTTFGTGGKVTTALGNYGDVGYAMVIQSDGKIVVAGYSDDASSNFFALVRYNSDGSLDTTFGSGGIVTTPFGNSDDQGQAVALQRDGKIVEGGWSYNGTDWDFALARYNTNGSLDSTFGTGGKVTTAMGTGDDVIYGVAIQSDGRIVGAGFDMANTFNQFALARYNSDGSLDSTFGSAGKVTTAIGTDDDFAGDIVILNDGRIVVAGTSSNGTDDDFAIARYNSNGSLDSTFGAGGKTTTTIGNGNDIGLSMALQSDGKMLLTGFIQNNGDRDFGVVRYMTDPVGISVANAERGLIVSPNPFSNRIFIGGIISSGWVRLLDLTGKELLKEPVTGPETTLQTERLLPGFYLLHYQDGHQTTSFKLVKL